MRQRARQLGSIGVAAATWLACTGSINRPGETASAGASGPGANAGRSGGAAAAGSTGAGGTSVSSDGIAVRPLRRLSALEFRNTAHDLLGVDAKMATVDFPADTLGASGFATPGTVGGVELDRIASAAEALATVAVARLDQLAPCTGGDEKACAGQFITSFGERAYRRPLRDDERASLQQLYDEARAAPLSYAHKDALRVLIGALLQSPGFLYHHERGAGPTTRDDGHVALDGWELASRLSYALWATMPDDELFARAKSGALTDPAELDKQARRLLSDGRARPVVEDFHAQWLKLNDLGLISKDSAIYPKFNAGLTSSMRAETLAFVRSAVLEDGKLDTLLTSTKSFVDARLAPLYGVSGVTGNDLRATEMPAGQRAGLLTQASFLSIAATPYGSSPVRRGHFITDRLLCTPPPPPPPQLNITPPKIDANAQTREVYVAHLTAPECKSCHVLMDPLGFGLEHYDGVGAWRAEEVGRPVDATGSLNLPSGDKSFDGAAQLGHVLAESPEVQQCVGQQWARYLVQSDVSDAGYPWLQTALAKFQSSGRDVRELIVSIATGSAFRLREAAEGEVLP